MRIHIRIFDGGRIDLDVEATDTIGPVMRHSERRPSGQTGLAAQLILGSASGALSRAAASELSEFWRGSHGSAIREHLASLAAKAAEEEQRNSELLRQRLQQRQQGPSQQLQQPSHVWAQWRLGPASVEELVIEFSRFILLKALSQDVSAPRVGDAPGSRRASGGSRSRSPARARERGGPDGAQNGCRFSPSGLVDQVWHEVMLFPKAYAALCGSLLGKGELFDHDPRAGHAADAGPRNTRYAATFKRYLAVFEEQPLGVVWDIPVSWEQDPELCVNLRSLKQRIAERSGIPSDQQRIIFNSTQLQDHQTLADCGVAQGSALSLILRMRGC